MATYVFNTPMIESGMQRSARGRGGGGVARRTNRARGLELHYMLEDREGTARDETNCSEQASYLVRIVCVASTPPSLVERWEA